MNKKAKNLAQEAENTTGNAVSTLRNKLGLKNSRTLWTTVGAIGLIGAGVAWQLMRKK